MTFQDGHHEPAERLALEDKIIVTTKSPDAAEESEERLEFEVVGIVRDSESAADYAVCYSEGTDEFIVTDGSGQLLSDDALAQEILDDFLAEQAECAEDQK